MVLRGCTQKALRWPILIIVFTILTLEFLAYLFVRGLVAVYEFSSRFRFRRAKQALKEANDFVSWCTAARELDMLEGRDEWKKRDESPYYDYSLIREHMKNLQQFRDQRNFNGLMSLLKLVLTTYNVGGINNHQLYNETHFGTKVLVHDFIQTVLESLIVVRDAEELPLQQRRDFFKRAKKWYGRTALMLSGGATMGYFHTGTIKTLIEAKCMPQILSGASAGSLMCAFLSVRTDQEILDDLCRPEGEKFFRACEEPFCVKFTRWLRYGYAFDKDHWRKLMRRDVTKGDTTFLEAYRKTGRIINIAVTKTNKYAPTLILNYRSTPDVIIWSAVLASSAFPNFLAPIELQIKNPQTGEIEPFHVHGHTFVDGTIKNDIPIVEMQKMWSANYFIVSQCNPHLTPFAYHGGSGQPALTLTKKASSGLRGGFILAMFEKLLKLDIKKWFKLIADLDLLPLIFGIDWRFIYLQKLTGTVTIVPDAPVWAYYRLISDPNYDRMKQYISIGEKASWSKLCRISNHFRIERMLIECNRVLEIEAKRAGLPVTREKFSHLNAGLVEHEFKLAAGVDDKGGANATNSSSSSSSTTRDRTHRERRAHPSHNNHTTNSSMSHSSGGSHAGSANSSPYPSPNSSPKPSQSPIVPLVDNEYDDDTDLPPSGEIADTATADLLTDASLPLWRRGQETDTDVTDDETTSIKETTEDADDEDETR